MSSRFSSTLMGLIFFSFFAVFHVCVLHYELGFCFPQRLVNFRSSLVVFKLILLDVEY